MGALYPAPYQLAKERQNMQINAILAHQLIQEQFPSWASLPVHAVKKC